MSVKWQCIVLENEKSFFMSFQLKMRIFIEYHFDIPFLFNKYFN